MKLYYIWQDENSQYDTYDSAVVAAPDEGAAINMHPNGMVMTPNEWGNRRRNTESSKWKTFGDWCTSPLEVHVEYIGEAAPNVQAGVICASFNAG